MPCLVPAGMMQKLAKSLRPFAQRFVPGVVASVFRSFGAVVALQDGIEPGDLIGLGAEALLVARRGDSLEDCPVPGIEGGSAVANPRVRCTIVEVGCDHGTGAEQTARDLLPWADPFIAQLVDRYRLRAALDDSLRFLESESSHQISSENPLPANRSARFRTSHGERFGLLFDGPHPWPHEG